MNREQLIKHWDVIVAFKNGKEIEVWEDCTYTFWRACYGDNIEFDINKKYRIKPKRFDYDYGTPNFMAGFIALGIYLCGMYLSYLITRDDVIWFFAFVGGGLLFMIITALYPKKIYKK